MMEFVQESLKVINLPFTILLLLVLVYWLFVVVGVLGLDAFDVDLDAWDADYDVDADWDGDFDADVEGEVSFGVATLKFFHFGEVPLMMIVSLFVLCMWASSMLANYYLNNERSWLVALFLLGPNLLLSLIVSKVILMPIVPIFRFMSAGEAARMKIVGKTCLITTNEVSEKFGQAEIAQDGPPIVINVRVEKGDYVTKGDVAIVCGYDKSQDTYRVRPVNAEKK